MMKTAQHNESDKNILRKPQWIRTRLPKGAIYSQTKKTISDLGLATVCEEAACPNIGECWASSHATIMIMGEICTRACAFCNVVTGMPNVLDPSEPLKVARAAQQLKLKHIVITSVDRDDLADGGASHFIATISALKQHAPQTTIEILTPDFRNKPQAIDILSKNLPDVFNHNLETVPRLYGQIRPGARYFGSLQLLAQMKQRHGDLFTKSGLMVGLGETKEEILQVMDDLRAAQVDFLTIGQYLRPTSRHAEVKRYITPDEFDSYALHAKSKGFLMVSSSPMTRSSYHAAQDFQKLKQSRLKEKQSAQNRA